MLEVLFGLSRYLNNNRESIKARFMLSIPKSDRIPPVMAAESRPINPCGVTWPWTGDGQCVAHAFH